MESKTNSEKSRRKFIKQATAAGSVALVAGCSSSDDSENVESGGSSGGQSTGNTTPTKEDTETEVETTTTDASTRHGTGESFVVGSGKKKMEYTVINSKFAEKLSTSYSEYTPSGQFLVVTIEYKNVGEETVDLMTNSFAALSPEGNEYDVDDEVQFAMDNAVSIEQVNPELGGKGVLVFDVPSGKSGWKIMFRPAGVLSTAEPHTVNLN